MNKSNLRTGMLVRLRNHETYYVMLGTGFQWPDQHDVLVHRVGNDTGWMPLSCYAADLTFHDDSPDALFPHPSEADREWDIMQVYACREAAYLFQPNHYRTIWTREE